MDAIDHAAEVWTTAEKAGRQGDVLREQAETMLIQRKKIQGLDAALDQTIRDRDQYHEWADKLAGAIAEHFHTDIGEHSNVNCPWAEALAAIENADSPTGADAGVPWSYGMSPPQDFIDYVKSNYSGIVDVHDAEWHTKRLWNAAMRSAKPPAVRINSPAAADAEGLPESKHDICRASERQLRDTILGLQAELAARPAAVGAANLPDAIPLLQRLKRDLMSARRFQPDTLDTYRRACTSAEMDIEEFMTAYKGFN